MELEIIAQSEAYGALVHDAVVKHIGTDRKLRAVGERNVVAVDGGSAKDSIKLLLLLVGDDKAGGCEAYTCAYSSYSSYQCPITINESFDISRN